MWLGKGERVPGDLGFRPFGDAKGDAAKQKTLQLQELKNGRLVRIVLGCTDYNVGIIKLLSLRRFID
jgi:hypothetical protein